MLNSFTLYNLVSLKKQKFCIKFLHTQYTLKIKKNEKKIFKSQRDVPLYFLFFTLNRYNIQKVTFKSIAKNAEQLKFKLLSKLSIPTKDTKTDCMKEKVLSLKVKSYTSILCMYVKSRKRLHTSSGKVTQPNTFNWTKVKLLHSGSLWDCESLFRSVFLTYFLSFLPCPMDMKSKKFCFWFSNKLCITCFAY